MSEQQSIAEPVGASARRPATTDSTSLALAVGIAGFATVAAVVNVVAATGFPSNAPVELLMSFGITIDLLAVAIVLFVRFATSLRRSRALAPARPRPGALAIAAIILAGVAFLGWFALGGATFLRRAVLEPDALRYMEDVAGLFVLGIPWVLGLVFGAIAFRRGAGIPHNSLAVIAMAASLVLIVPTLYSGIAYGLGLTD